MHDRHRTPGHQRTHGAASFALAATLAVLVVGVVSMGAAGAAAPAFSMYPSSGPPGTVVSVAGSSCSPGSDVSATRDYVRVTLAPSALSVDIAVARNGSWSGSFTLPTHSTRAPVVVAAACFTDGVISSTYSPHTMMVTAGAPTTPTSRGLVAGPALTPGAAAGGAPVEAADASARAALARNRAAISAQVAAAAATPTPTETTSPGGHGMWIWWVVLVVALAGGAALMSWRRGARSAARVTAP